MIKCPLGTFQGASIEKLLFHCWTGHPFNGYGILKWAVLKR